MYFDPEVGLVLITIDADEGVPLRKIETPCDVVISPAAPAQVILREEDGRDLVFDAAYGSLPDGAVVVAVKNDSGTFPEATSLRVRVILDPYQAGDEPFVLDADPEAWADGCPICGKLGGDGSDDDWRPDDQGEDPDAGGDEPEDEDPPVYPMPRRFVYDELIKPSNN